jgi:FHS family Na+ dependent glucose MFS transporter 1
LHGSTLGGRLGDRLPNRRDHLLWGAVAMLGVATVLLARQTHVWLLALVSVGQALSAGVLDNLAQVLVLSLKDVHVEPVMQTLHCGYGVGALLGPWLASFVLPDHVLPPIAAAPTRAGGLSSHAFDPASAASGPDPAHFHLAFYIVAAFTLPPLLVHAYLLLWAPVPPDVCVDPVDVGVTSDPKTDQAALVPKSDAGPVSVAGAAGASAHRQLVLLVCVFLFLYAGCENGWGSYLATYASRQLEFTVKDASLLTSAYWFSFALGRFLGIFVSMRVSAGRMIEWSLVTSLAALAVMCMLVDVSAVLWIGSMFYGAGLCTYFFGVFILF